MSHPNFFSASASYTPLPQRSSFNRPLRFLWKYAFLFNRTPEPHRYLALRLAGLPVSRPLRFKLPQFKWTVDLLSQKGNATTSFLSFDYFLSLSPFPFFAWPFGAVG